jgi:hypothetical protein
MLIKYGTPIRYFDSLGNEIHDGDYVILEGRKERVYLTDDGYLGTDATNPKWIETGRAFTCQYGIYPFNEKDEPVLVKENIR